MTKYTRRKFVEAAMAGGAGITLISDIARAENINREIPAEPFQAVSSPAKINSDRKIIENQELYKDSLPPEFNTMRPIRNRQKITVTVGQTEGDLKGSYDKALQAAIDYVYNLGGGTVKILPGTYTMRNSLFPKPGITIRGSGDKTILFKSPSVSSKIIREADWFEYGVQVENPEGFTRGCGLALSTDDKDPHKCRSTKDHP